MAGRPRGEAQQDGSSGTSGSTAAEPSFAPGPSKRAVSPGLHLVATPIGNVGDITLRALDVLRGADLIACEDTRVSAKLLDRYGIRTRRIAYHDHNAERVRPGLIRRLQEGGTIALIADAGTPLVSDPGFKLARAAIEEGLHVEALPGASALLTALLLSGLPSDRFLFAGFLDAKSGARRNDLARLAAVPATLLFYEAPQRLAATLADMAAMLGDRPAAVARELTKLHEEVVRGMLAQLAERYAETGPPRGEIVIVVGPPAHEATPEAELDRLLRQALDGASTRDAAQSVAAATGLPRRLVYARALALAAERE